MVNKYTFQERWQVEEAIDSVVRDQRRIEALALKFPAAKETVEYATITNDLRNERKELELFLKTWSTKSHNNVPRLKKYRGLK